MPYIAGKMGNSLTLESSFIKLGGQSKLIDGNGDPEDFYFTTSQNAYLKPIPSIGSGIMNVKASTLELTGIGTLQGFFQANLSSQFDTVLTSNNSYFDKYYNLDTKNYHPEAVTYLPGRFSMVGNLILTNSQIYPGTLSQFELVVNDTSTSAFDGSILFKTNGNSLSNVYSAAGSIAAFASSINQKGVLKAPLGTIILGNQDQQGYVHCSRSPPACPSRLRPRCPSFPCQNPTSCPSRSSLLN
jgi:hypothetical protein